MIGLAQDGLYIYAALLLAYWFWGKPSNLRQIHREAALSAGITGVFGLLINVLIAHFFFRPRPFVTLHTVPLIHHAADASFPSDHTTGSTGLAGGAYLRDHAMGTFFAILALLIGFSRVYVGVHYPTDVLGGFGVGLFSTFVVAAAKKPMDHLIKQLIANWEKISARLSRVESANKS
ncbi:hypothetical protein BM613_11520 [Sulfoacidibacillus thermotolerans]|uniref:Phosphatidic acid phosphatase type 2/haloperoxidase domain-containing protein n=2 Tax=Sulfoacidibacillus thermotolerans TaxID=1765684 RepID=A0A2U3D6H2_SULT2|nr:hypothetical protein BM613_11520 [Sulfoacidibacillus thermotolerans]